MIINRKLSAILLKRSKQYPVIAIVGPRQSGKTTLAKTMFPKKSIFLWKIMIIENSQLMILEVFLPGLGKGLF